MKDYKRGHIHSHNTMSVFFSGTDNSELVDNAPNYNYYVSLIVNNRNDMMARVAFVTKVKSLDKKTFVFKGNEGEDIVVENAEQAKEEEKVYYYDCDIQVEESSDVVEKELVARLAEVRAKKAAAVPSTSKLSYEEAIDKFGTNRWAGNQDARWNSGSNGGYGGYANGGSTHQGSFFPSDKTERKQSDFKNWREKTAHERKNNRKEEETADGSDYFGYPSQFHDQDTDFEDWGYGKNSTIGNVSRGDDAEREVDIYEDSIEDFVIQYIMDDLNGVTSSRFTSVDEAIETISEVREKMTKREWYNYCKNLTSNFQKMYDNTFEDPQNKHVATTVSDCINALRLNQPIGTSVCVEDLIKSLEDVMQ